MVFHRHYACPAWEPWSRDRIPPDLKKAAVEVRKMGSPYDELFSLGIFADPTPLFKRPVWSDHWKWCHVGWEDPMVVPSGSLGEALRLLDAARWGLPPGLLPRLPVLLHPLCRSLVLSGLRRARPF